MHLKNIKFVRSRLDYEKSLRTLGKFIYLKRELKASKEKEKNVKRNRIKVYSTQKYESNCEKQVDSTGVSFFPKLKKKLSENTRSHHSMPLL